jgi:tetratricopeptide (TPR) repeat protein
MKKLIIILLFFLISFNINSQQLSYGNKIEAINICKQLGSGSIPEPVDEEIEKVLEKIISITGLEKNFQLQLCGNTNNASALTYNGIRYIFYDKNFLESISGENRWFVTYVLAHEVAHHLQDHTKDVYMYLNGFPKDISLEDRRLQELEADKWAGFILGKLGASFENTIDAVSQIPNDEYENPQSSHPHEELRIKATVEGFNNAVGGIAGLQFDKYQKNNSGKYLFHFYNGVEKYNKDDLDGALKDFNKSIIDKKEFPEPYINRSLIKEEKGDLYGAISDLELAMKWNPNLDILYVERGRIKSLLGKHQSALDDYNLAISKNSKSIKAYFNKAALLHNAFIGAVRLNNNIDVLEIIKSFDKCIEIYPDYLEARSYRAQVIIGLLKPEDYNNLDDNSAEKIRKAKADLDISLTYVDDYQFMTPVSITFFKLNNYFLRAMLNYNLMNYSMVMSDSNNIIEISRNFLDREKYLEKFVQANLLKVAVLEDDRHFFYDISELCKHIYDFKKIMESLKNYYYDNQIIYESSKYLIETSSKYDCN